MFYLLILAAVVFFIAHVGFLIASFTGSQFGTKRYFYSHLTLWITGVLIFLLAVLYSGNGQSQFLDYFNTPLKKAMILVVTAAVSLLAHCIVKFLVLPAVKKN